MLHYYIAVRTLKSLGLSDCEINMPMEYEFGKLRKDVMIYVKSASCISKLPPMRSTIQDVTDDCIRGMKNHTNSAERYLFAYRMVQMYRDYKPLYIKVLEVYIQNSSGEYDK